MTRFTKDDDRAPAPHAFGPPLPPSEKMERRLLEAKKHGEKLTLFLGNGTFLEEVTVLDVERGLLTVKWTEKNDEKKQRFNWSETLDLCRVSSFSWCVSRVPHAHT